MSNLPAGQFITTINGKQCTARPQTRTSASLASAASAASASSVAIAQAASASQAALNSQSAQAQASSAAAAAVAASTTAQAQETTSPLASVAPAATSTTPEVANTTPTQATAATTVDPAATSISSAAAVSIEDDPTSQTVSATAAPSVFSSTPIPIAQSETTVPLNSFSTSTINTGLAAAAQSSATATEAVESAASGISSTGTAASTNLMPMVGGVIGGVALVGIIGVIFWFFRKRRRARRDSFLTPLTTNDEKGYYGQDGDSMASTNGSWRSKIRAPQEKLGGMKDGIVGFGSSLMAKVLPDRSATPNVNLNRGNSQFMDGAIPQHSRSNSTMSQASRLQPTDRLQDWWADITENLATKLRIRKRRESVDPFAAARSITRKESQSNTTKPDFSKLLNMNDNDLQLEAERRRTLLRDSNLGSLGLNFNTESQDPFADPASQANKWTPPKPTMHRDANNPFRDPIAQPEATMARTQTVIADIRRSRGQSIDATNVNNNISAYAATAYSRPPSTAITSRYPSTMAPSRDSYRDTIFSNSTRKGKGRSDPFDLDRHDFWKTTPPPSMPTNANQTLGGFSTVTDIRGSAVPDPLGMPGYKKPQATRVVSNAASSKYSSGVSDLSGWGEPGPDVGSPSTTSYMQNSDQMRSVSPVSAVSSRYGVGKAR